MGQARVTIKTYGEFGRAVDKINGSIVPRVAALVKGYLMAGVTDEESVLKDIITDVLEYGIRVKNMTAVEIASLLDDAEVAAWAEWLEARDEMTAQKNAR